jgi:tripartite-type tricarboxylate transporter receptor subunit TctC
MLRRTLVHAVVGATAVAGAPRLFAQPAPLRLLVGFAAGGGIDACARIVAEQLRNPSAGRSSSRTAPALRAAWRWKR